MLLISCLFVCIAELIVAPTECRCCIRTRQTEFHVVTGIVHTAFAVEAAVTVRIELFPVLFDPGIRQVNTFVVLSVLLQRNMLVFHMAVCAPFQSAGALAALIGIIEMKRVLKTFREIHLYIIVGETVRIRKFLVGIINGARVLTC